MPKFSFYEIKCNKFPAIDKQTGMEIPNADPVVIDTVLLQFSKKVNLKNMHGEKGENFTVDAVDIPGLFGVDVKLPAMIGYDCSARIASIKQLLDKFIGKPCMIEQIEKGKRQILSYIEFE